MDTLRDDTGGVGVLQGERVESCLYRRIERQRLSKTEQKISGLLDCIWMGHTVSVEAQGLQCLAGSRLAYDA